MQLNTVLLISGGWVQALQLLAALSLLILLHEFGHFFFARLFKTRVEKFYLFFDFLFPFPGLLNFSLFKKKKGDTEYGLGWFPLGGYVKISGMVDESMDKEAMEKPPEPWEYRSKKAWQRLFIMLGGILVNIIVAIFIYIIIYGIWGEKYLPIENAKYGIVTDSIGRSVGFRNGDKILTVGGNKVDRFNGIMKEFIFKKASQFEVERDGQVVSITVPEGTVKKIIKARGKKGSFIGLRSPFLVGDVDKGSLADSMGLKKGDSIYAFNGVPIRFYDEFEAMKKHYSGRMFTLDVMRDGKSHTLATRLPHKALLGFKAEQDAERYFDVETIHYGFGGAVARGFTATWETFTDYWEQFRFLFTSKEVKASESLGGIVSFGQMFPTEFSWETFLYLTAFVSIILAFMNLLPIPGLDGGYVIFLLYELVSGRKVSDKIMERATTVGLVLLLGLMLYANGLDIFRLFGN
jgi:regulator of sigma E protease